MSMQLQAQLSELNQRPRTILVADDSDDLLTLMRAILSKWGWQVQTAEDGQKAYERFLECQPDIAIIDIGMPIMDGYQTARELRRTCTDRPYTLIALSGYCGEKDKELAIAAGFDFHMTKPANFRALQELLETCHMQINASYQSVNTEIIL